MVQRFLEGQAVNISITDGENGREYATRVLHVSGRELTLRRPPKLNGLSEKGVQVTVRPAGDDALSTQCEFQGLSGPGQIRVRCLDWPQIGEQRRDMLRQADELPIRFRVISGQKHDRTKTRFESGTSSPSASRGVDSARPAEVGGESESPILDCLQQINQKLDRIIELMPRRAHKGGLDRSGVIRDISGSGLRFQTDRPVDDGSVLEFQLNLPGRLTHTVLAVAEVKRVKVYASVEGERYWEVAVHFTSIEEFDRDRIVAHVLHKQRASIKG